MEKEKKLSSSDTKNKLSLNISNLISNIKNKIIKIFPINKKKKKREEARNKYVMKDVNEVIGINMKYLESYIGCKENNFRADYFVWQVDKCIQSTLTYSNLKPEKYYEKLGNLLVLAFKKDIEYLKKFIIIERNKERKEEYIGKLSETIEASKEKSKLITDEDLLENFLYYLERAEMYLQE